MPFRPALLLALLATLPAIAPPAHADQHDADAALGLRLRIIAACQPGSDAPGCPPRPQADSPASPAPAQVRALTPPSPQQAADSAALTFDTQAF
jgi:hypothetical protein